jgi:pyruvate/2-oxoglutarate/acetoin dehydrogenase E1 component/TPP-dependent pyruvate/acetoin dehydrogenase alpha subunit
MADAKSQVIEQSTDRDGVLADYRLVYRSRQVSIIGRREVMSGKAKFGIFGDGKELAQIAMAKAFQKGDFRSGYYRDQTFMFAIGATSVQEFFAQLFAHTDVEADPATAGRSMNAHFATRSLNPDGTWKNLTEIPNSSADVSPTGSQLPRLVGLAYASRLFRELETLQQFEKFSKRGDEIAFGTVGNATTAEGMFWESLNAIGVLQAPVLISIWDDGYGISVPNEFQNIKDDLSEMLQGFRRQPGTSSGYNLYQVRGWDYTSLIEVYQKAAASVRRHHIPAIIHVKELTQPQGHSTSGSHERYKSQERLIWENEFDCLVKFRKWITNQGIAGDTELQEIEFEEHDYIEKTRKNAWEAYLTPILDERGEVANLIQGMSDDSPHQDDLIQIKKNLLAIQNPLRRDIMSAVTETLVLSRGETNPERIKLAIWKKQQTAINEERFGSHLYNPSANSALKVQVKEAIFSEKSPTVHGFELLNACFDAALTREPRLFAFGEDVGKLGDVNQGFRGLQDKFGELRVSDTGIRETTIIGQAIGMAMRGLRPIAEIQYLDYLLYALQILSDDLATLHWRTKGGQIAPVIVRTRGHRLEGIWHSGSLMAGIINLVRGMHVLVPRNMTQAAGFYNTLLLAEDPALVIEVLNGYRIKERLPDNIGEFTVPLGIPETLLTGEDVTIVTYGACCRIALDAARKLNQVRIQAEVIDVQTLIPFDIHHEILKSLKKTSRILFIDEDVPGGTTAYMLQQVIEKQGGYSWLDSPPRTLPGKPHRPAYGSDGDYFSKPNADDIFETVYKMMNEVDPTSYPVYD